MQPFVDLFGPLDALHEYVEVILLVLVLANMVTRRLAHSRHVGQYDDGGADAIRRYRPHVATNVLLVLASFYYLTVDQYAGMITSVLVVGTVLTDFFEFESRKVEARRDLELDLPKAAIGAWALAFFYVLWKVLLPDGPIGAFV